MSQEKRPVILQINVTLNYGSTGRLAELLGEKIMEKGWESFIAFGRSERKSKSHSIKISGLLSVFYHVFLTRIFDKHGLGSRQATKKLIRKITKIKPDIIHLHNIHGYYLNYKILFDFLSKTQTKVLWTLHDCWAFTGHCTHYEEVGCYKWKEICHHCPQKKEFPASFLLDNSKQNYLHKKKAFQSTGQLKLVTVSDWLKKQTEQSFLRDLPSKRVYNGIDLKQFDHIPESNLRNRLKLKDKFILLGVATVWNDKKGLQRFINLASNLKSDEIIVLIGITKKQIKKFPRNIIGIQPTQDLQELVEFYNVADVFLNLSLEESFGLVSVEAMACGTPVITTDSTANAEVVTAHTGVVCRTVDTSSLIDAIRQIKSNGKEFYSANCKEHVKRNFSIEAMTNNYIGLYEGMLSKTSVK
ncbi:MAG TPA: glycosyl transferase [Bacteroidales bacterium]|nr:glycosyl transferase [Bacteroidales bacterium]